MEKLDKRNIEDVLALTPMQEGMLFHYLKEPGSDHYFEQLTLEIFGEIDLKIFEKAWDFVIETNDMLRAAFRWEKVENPVQIVLKEHKLQPAYYDFTGKENKEKGEEKIKIQDRREKFDLKEVPFRVTLCKLEESKYVMIISNHHILYDGWSNGIILKEFFKAYDDLSNGKILVKPIKTKFKEFIKWIQNQDKYKQEEFWRNYLEGFDTQTELPVKRKKGKEITNKRNVRFTFGKKRRLELESFTKEHKVTLASLLYCAWGILLKKYNNTGDVIFGTTVSGRAAKIQGIEEIVGLFINTVPMRVQAHPNEKLEELVYRINDSLKAREEFENSSLMRIREYRKLDSSEELFDSILAIENYPIDRQLITEKGKLSLNSFSMFEMSHYDLTVGIRVFDDIEFIFSYNKKVFDEKTIIRLTGHFRGIVEKIIKNPGQKIVSLEIITKKEKEQLLAGFNNTNFEADYPHGKTIHQLFETQVEKNPDCTAVIGRVQDAGHRAKSTKTKNHNTTVTYRQLNQQSNRLSHLFQEKGVGPETFAAIMVEHSVEMIIGILGILKAGGAYLPIDPDYPEERIYYMLADSAAKVLVTTRILAEEGKKVRRYKGEKIFFSLCYQGRGEVSSPQPEPPPASSSLAYIIYTSGTTGKPKGVLIEHRNVVRLMFNEKFLFDFSHRDVWTMFHSYCFDFSVWEMYGALLYGGKLVVIPRMVARDPEQYLRVLKKEKVTILNQTPSAFYNLMDAELNHCQQALNIRYVIFGGEALKPFKIKRWQEKYPGTKLINMFGITETTVHVTFKEITKKELELDISNIGKTIPTLAAWVMDKYVTLMPIGVPGELYVTGEGVGRGYLNKPGLTAGKFIEGPFKSSDGERLYKSGDLVRLLENGDMEYLGRVDHQVKIRGFRIELGEIENQLQKHNKIKEAVVLAKENEAREKYLSAYIVPKAPHCFESLKVTELRDFLSQKLPDSMMPSYFVALPQLPLSPNGKIDAKSLPDPPGIALGSGTGFCAPRSVIEKKLVDSWEKILGREKIGINDNFFMIGGDSIKTIQIAARMKAAGYRVEVKDILQNPTIKELAPLVKKLKRIADQSTIMGRLALTPIQREFFLFSLKAPHHFNMSKILYSKNGFDEEVLRSIFLKIQEHHDVLRMTYRQDKDEIIQENHGLDYPFSLQVFDYMDLEDALKAIESKANEIQQSIDLENGPLMKLALFHVAEGDYLLIIFHHLVIDGVSWRILFEDIEILYQQHKKGEQLLLPLKTDSFKVWVEKLSAYANSEPFLKEKAYWARLESTPVPAIKRDFAEKNNYVNDTVSLSFILTPGETNQLLAKVNHAFNTKINDLLLTGLALGLKKTFGYHRFLVALEGHGREEIFQDIDVNRTFGWFTIVYPVLLNSSYEHDLSRQLKEIKETLHRVPNKGIGYGILKYLTAAELKKDLDFQIEPQISFNYLGQFNADFQQISFAGTDTSISNSVGLNEQRKYDFDISGIIEGNRLIMSIAYNKRQYKSETIARLWKNYEIALKRVISSCAAVKMTQLTPCDFTYKGLSIEKAGQLSSEYSLEDIYTLSPMQKGMLFETLKEKNTSTYFEQISYRIHGHLDVTAVRKSLHQLFKRHEILRTVFIHEGIAEPVQAVLKCPEVDIHYENLTGLPGNREKNIYIKEFKKKDIQRSFDLEKNLLLRLALFQLDITVYELVWSFHHILLDGWSVGILNSEFFEIYNSYLENREYRLPLIKPYREYIEWLQRINETDSKTYWKNYLEGYGKSTGIPHKKEIRRGQKRHKKEGVSFVLEIEKTRRLKELAGKNHVTLNTVIQTIWGIILGKYNSRQDVLFGAVVSGRPSEIEGAESIVGLFLNTVPVRVKYDKETKVTQLLKWVQEKAIESEPHHYYPLSEVQSGSLLKQKLLDHILVFENYPLEQQLELAVGKGNESNGRITMQLSDIESYEQISYDFHVIILPGDQLTIILKFNVDVHDKKSVKKIASHFEDTIDQILENEMIAVGKISFLLEEKKQPILDQFNDDLENE